MHLQSTTDISTFLPAQRRFMVFFCKSSSKEQCNPGQFTLLLGMILYLKHSNAKNLWRVMDATIVGLSLLKLNLSTMLNRINKIAFFVNKMFVLSSGVMAQWYNPCLVSKKKFWVQTPWWLGESSVVCSTIGLDFWGIVDNLSVGSAIAFLRKWHPLRICCMSLSWS